jgi:peptide/nickel transport system permease protein
MTGFLVRRILSSLLVLWLTSVFVFVLFLKGMGDYPAINYCDSLRSARCSPEALKAIEHEMGLDKSVAANYGIWAKGIVLGRQRVYMDGKYYRCPAPCLGISTTTQEPIWNDLRQKYPATLSLALGGGSLYLTLGILLGCLAARWRGTTLDRALVGATLVWSSIPRYLITLFAWLVFYLKLGLFPDTGYHPFFDNPVRWFTGLLLPWLVMVVATFADYARYTRGQVVENLGEDFVVTARSKGARPVNVLFRHALRAAIVPVVTVFGLDFATLLAGTVYVETIFGIDGIDGIGRWGLQAIVAAPMDIDVIQTTVLLAAVLVVMGNLVIDVFYSFLDPRVTVS